MKLSFSTRGWNSASWDDLVKDAVEYKFQGIEVYHLSDCKNWLDRSLLKTWYLSCLQLCILTILGYGKHELCKIFHLAQKIPMTASNVIEFQVISFALALK